MIDWKSISDPVPKPLVGERLLVYCTNGDVFALCGDDTEWRHEGGDEVYWYYVTHWAAMPTTETIQGIDSRVSLPVIPPLYWALSNLLVFVDGQWETGRYESPMDGSPVRWRVRDRVFDPTVIERWYKIETPGCLNKEES